MKLWFKAFVGLILVFFVHIPRALFSLLVWSYSLIFANRPNLTADPREHLRRARTILRRRKNSELLYAAIEIRFALERMAQREIATSEVPNRARKNYDPVKKLKALHRADPNTKFPHRFWLLIRGRPFEDGEYIPLDLDRANEIKGRLGNLLHPKEGLMLGVHDATWYSDTRDFLWSCIDYLWPIADRSSPYMWRKGLPYHLIQRKQE